jgi:hypothetical protein
MQPAFEKRGPVSGVAILPGFNLGEGPVAPSPAPARLPQNCRCFPTYKGGSSPAPGAPWRGRRAGPKLSEAAGLAATRGRRAPDHDRERSTIHG